ncbi:MAG: DUF885 family protein [Candidatus Marinimicrobia bacterium]|jgi:hypothetical protein|nr:DUF885 family protein [Candidatus Neomarinimicrobiota bacterium]
MRILLLLLFFTSLQSQSNYNSLQNLFIEWRKFENPPLLNGAPDYTKKQFNKRKSVFNKLQKKLNNIDTTNWSKSKQVDWQIIEAEMNGYDFNFRVLKSWIRDPAFYQTIWMYQSDVPAHEGPVNHALLEYWQYTFPLNKQAKEKFHRELALIPAFLEQAKQNLTGNARDLWVAGINNLRDQTKYLNTIEKTLNEYQDKKKDKSIFEALQNAKVANNKFIRWLESEAPKKNGPSGIGKENYTWYQQNVHRVPLTWEEEVQLLQRELDRAWSSLKLEEERNKKLPLMKSADTPDEFKVLTDNAVKKMMRFLSENDIMYIKDNMEPALREHMGKYVPKDDRNFFSIGLHYDPLPLYSHLYHWFDLAEVRDNPHKNLIRRGPPLYNMYDSKNEGIATAVEEMFMHAGLYEDNPRSREIVWIMLAQRAARGLGSLYAHANMMTMAEAGQVHVKWTPRGWMEREPHLLQFEQHLYLRQPGYGTCYITGKYLIENLMTEYAEKLETEKKEFYLKDFLNAFNNAGNIPVELIRQEMVED